MIQVAPLAGAWIEITQNLSEKKVMKVAPLAGAWIEMAAAPWTRPQSFVAPLAGAWIEIAVPVEKQTDIIGRSPRGSVD